MSIVPPKVALLIPAYNCQEELNATVRQLPAEEPLHILIVDDGSTPPMQPPPCDPVHTLEIVRNKVNRKVHGALRRGCAILAAQGFAYVARLDAGDFALPDRFRLQRAFLDEHPDVAIVGSAYHLLENGRESHYRYSLDDAQIRKLILFREQLCHPAVMMRLDAVLAVGNYRDAYPCVEDRDLFVRLLSRFKAANLPEFLTRKIEHSGSVTVRHRRRMLTSLLRLQLAYMRPRCAADWAGLAKTACHWLLPHWLFDWLKLRYLHAFEASSEADAEPVPAAVLRLATTPAGQHTGCTANDGA